MNEPDRFRLEHVREQIDRIARYTAGGRASFDADDLTQDAVLRCLTVLGEAAVALSPDTYQLIESLPSHLPKGQRNLIVHEYWRIDLDIVWATITDDLPLLRSEIEAILSQPSGGFTSTELIAEQVDETLSGFGED